MSSQYLVCLCLGSIPETNQANDDNDAGDLKNCIPSSLFCQASTDQTEENLYVVGQQMFAWNN